MPDNEERGSREDDGERSLEELVEEAAEGLWLKFRDVILLRQKLERFVF